jgi:hypothetical protein
MLRVVGWLSALGALACLVGLYWLARDGFEQHDPRALALLLHGGQALALFAHGLGWRATGTSFHWAGAWAVYATTLAWLYTWFEPLQDLVAWARTLGRILIEIGAAW